MIKNEQDKRYAERRIGELVAEIEQFENEINYRKNLVFRLTEGLSNYDNFGFERSN